MQIGSSASRIATFACILWIAANPAIAQEAAELSAIYERFLQTQDPEQAISLGSSALKAEAASQTWTLASPRETFRFDVHSALGRAYVNRALGVRADNIEAAIENFTAALAIPAGGNDPERAAEVHTNLAVAYWNRIRGDRADSEDRALSHFETAQETYSRERNPKAWAQIESNLAALFLTRLRGDRGANIDRAIAHLEGALGVLSQDAEPQLWAAAHSNLGNAYRVKTSGELEQNLQSANTHFERALQVFTRGTAPFQWAQIQIAIASTLQKSEAPGNRDAAVSRLRDALGVFTQEAFPQQWAQTHYELGNALSDAKTGDVVAHRRAAVAAYRSALTVLTLQGAPFNHLQVTRRLANTLMQLGDCRNARFVHASAREAFLTLFGQQLDRVSTANLVNEAGPMFADAAYCAVERGEIDSAVKLANEGRARLLAVSLKLQTLDLRPEDKHRLEELRTAIRNEELAVGAETGEKRAAALDRLSALRRDLLSLLDTAKPAGRPSDDANEIALRAAGATGAVVMPVVTVKGAKLLLFSGRNRKWVALDFPEVTLPRIAGMLAGKEKGSHGWIEAYFANYFQGEEQQRRWPQWLAAIDDTGHQLWKLFGDRLQLALVANHVTAGSRLVLMPSGRLGILPLGLAKDPVSGQRLIDRFEVVYAPSLEVLASAERQIADPAPASLAAVVNPTGDLPGTEKEGALVASHFPDAERSVLARDAATVEAVLSALKGRTYWHFASHGTFAWQDVGSSALIMSGADRLSISRLADAGDLGRPRLVVLSACETGLSEIVTANPEEFVGLPGSFVGLGAAGVVGTLWPVADDATAFLIAKFYELHIEKKLSPPAALRQAQLWLRDASADDLSAFASDRRVDPRHVTDLDGSLKAATARLGSAGAARTSEPAPPAVDTAARPYAHPYYWGGFIYTGL